VPLGTKVGLVPGHIVLDGDPAPPERGTAAPSFRPMSIVAKWSPISPTAEYFFVFLYFSGAYFCLCTHFGVILRVFLKSLLPSSVINHHCWQELDRISLWRHLVNDVHACVAISESVFGK